MYSELASYLRHNGGNRGFFQFRLITKVKGVEFGSPVYRYDEMLEVLEKNGIDWEHLNRIDARPAGRLEWETL